MQLLVFLPDMALELPSDVGSSSASEESQVELPEEMQKTSGCCKKNCVAEVSKDAFQAVGPDPFAVEPFRAGSGWQEHPLV